MFSDTNKLSKMSLLIQIIYFLGYLGWVRAQTQIDTFSYDCVILHFIFSVILIAPIKMKMLIKYHKIVIEITLYNLFDIDK